MNVNLIKLYVVKFVKIMVDLYMDLFEYFLVVLIGVWVDELLEMFFSSFFFDFLELVDGFLLVLESGVEMRK